MSPSNDKQIVFVELLSEESEDWKRIYLFKQKHVYN